MPFIALTRAEPVMLSLNMTADCVVSIRIPPGYDVFVKYEDEKLDALLARSVNANGFIDGTR